jgi:hypothetical protein
MFHQGMNYFLCVLSGFVYKTSSEQETYFTSK